MSHRSSFGFDNRDSSNQLTLIIRRNKVGGSSNTTATYLYLTLKTLTAAISEAKAIHPILDDIVYQVRLFSYPRSLLSDLIFDLCRHSSVRGETPFLSRLQAHTALLKRHSSACLFKAHRIPSY